MKKVYSILFVVLFLSINLSAKTIVLEEKENPCHVANAIFLDSFEEQHGCLTADQYNGLMEFLNSFC